MGTFVVATIIAGSGPIPIMARGLDCLRPYAPFWPGADLHPVLLYPVMRTPPSMLMVWPVMARASSLAR